MGPKIQQWTPPTIFELGRFLFQGLLVTYVPTKSWNDFFYLGPRFRARPQKGPKIEKMNSSYSLWARIFNFSGIIGYPWANRIKQKIFLFGAPFWGQAPKGPQ